VAANTQLGSFEELVMLAVVRTGAAAYGMNVRREIEAVTRRDIAIGAVYATLDRLEAKHLVASTRETLDGASRRVFTVTRAGAQAVADARAVRDRLWRGIDAGELLRE
jgi:PadR family transcriptional regulator, regulatory protein PadR